MRTEIKKKYLERKLSIVEKEIGKWESKQNTANVNLREYKQKQWDLIEQLEQLEANHD